MATLPVSARWRFCPWARGVTGIVSDSAEGIWKGEGIRSGFQLLADLRLSPLPPAPFASDFHANGAGQVES